MQSDIAGREELIRLGLQCRGLAQTLPAGEMKDELIKMALEYELKLEGLTGDGRVEQER